MSYLFAAQISRSIKFSPSWKRLSEADNAQVAKLFGRNILNKWVVKSYFELPATKSNKLPLGLKLMSIRIVKIRGADSVLFLEIEDQRPSLKRFLELRKISHKVWAHIAKDYSIRLSSAYTFDALGYFIDNSNSKVLIEDGLIHTSSNSSPFWTVEVGREILLRVAIERSIAYWNMKSTWFLVPIRAVLVRRWPTKLLFDREYARTQLNGLRESLNLDVVVGEQLARARQWWTLAAILLSLAAIVISATDLIHNW